MYRNLAKASPEELLKNQEFTAAEVDLNVSLSFDFSGSSCRIYHHNSSDVQLIDNVREGNSEAYDKESELSTYLV